MILVPRIPKEKKQGIDKLEDNCKENFKSSGQKRVREHNEKEGEQLWEEGTVQHSKCQKIQLDPNNPKVEVASRNWSQVDK